ncbi:Putative ribonuclease H protein [Arachis hypogaea]|nr:Putative ribonuclease H protein [Arachis hypogaea]
MEIKRLEAMNEVFLVKLLWHLLKNEKALWSEVLRSKYGRGKNLLHELQICSSDSTLWRSLAKVWNCLIQNTYISIGDGRSTKLWTDKWIKGGSPLIQCIAAGEEVDLSLTVHNAITVAGEWNVTYLQNFLTEDILSTIKAMPPAMDSMGQDTLT